MVEAKTVLSDYHNLVSDYQGRLDRMEQNTEGWIDMAYLFLTLLLVLLAATQLGLLTQGIALLA